MNRDLWQLRICQLILFSLFLYAENPLEKTEDPRKCWCHCEERLHVQMDCINGKYCRCAGTISYLCKALVMDWWVRHSHLLMREPLHSQGLFLWLKSRSWPFSACSVSQDRALALGLPAGPDPQEMGRWEKSASLFQLSTLALTCPSTPVGRLTPPDLSFLFCAMVEGQGVHQIIFEVVFSCCPMFLLLGPSEKNSSAALNRWEFQAETSSGQSGYFQKGIKMQDKEVSNLLYLSVYVYSALISFFHLNAKLIPSKQLHMAVKCIFSLNILYVPWSTNEGFCGGKHCRVHFGVASQYYFGVPLHSLGTRAAWGKESPQDHCRECSTLSHVSLLIFKHRRVKGSFLNSISNTVYQSKKNCTQPQQLETSQSKYEASEIRKFIWPTVVLDSCVARGSSSRKHARPFPTRHSCLAHGCFAPTTIFCFPEPCA